MFIMLPEFKIAFEKARLVNEKLHCASEKFVALPDIVEAVQELSGYDIRTSFLDFTTLQTSDDDVEDDENDEDNLVLKQAGAMLATIDDGTQKKAQIVVNEAKSAQQKRFATVHELGHLITKIPNYSYVTDNDGAFTVSTQINADITFISEDDCKNSDFLKAEQVANIFALLVLIPDEITIQKMASEGPDALAEKYGVTPEMLYSRMLITVMS